MIRILGLALVMVSLGGWVAAGDAEPQEEEDLAELARRFAVRFTNGEHERNLARMTEPMREASGPVPSESLRTALVAKHGDVREVGHAWFEDHVQGFERYRVPVHFERESVDFRIVFDAAGRIAGFWIVPHASPPAAADAAPGRQSEVSIGTGESAIPGTLTIPDGPGPFPAALLVHGSGPHDRDETIGPNKPFRDLAWGLAERGVATLRYDKRSYARPADLVQVGDSLTVREEVLDDARRALALLRERAEIDASRIFVIGHSLGGTLAPRIAAAEPRPAGLVSLAGSTLPLPEKILSQTRYVAELDGEVSRAEQARLDAIAEAVRTLRAALEGDGPAPAGVVLGAPFGYFEDLEAHDPAAEAARLGLPVLVLQGDRDYQVTAEDFQRWREELASKPFACLVTYDGLDHLFRAGTGPSGPADYDRQAPVDPRVIDDIADWIAKGRCPRPVAGRRAP